MIVRFNHLLGLDIDSFAGSRFVMNNSAHFAFETRRDGDNQSSLADGGSSIRIHKSVRLGLPQDRSQGATDTALQVHHLPPYACQLRRRMVCQLAVTIQDSVDFLDHLPQRAGIAHGTEFFQRRITRLVQRTEECLQLGGIGERLS